MKWSEQQTLYAFHEQYRSGLGLVAPSGELREFDVRQTIADILLLIPVSPFVIAAALFGSAAYAVSLSNSQLQVLACILIAEALFFAWHKRHVEALNERRQIAPEADIIGTVRKIAIYVSKNDPVKFWRGWFKGAPMESIKRDNVAHFLSANFLSLPLESASARRREEIEESIDLIEQVTGYTFPAGRTPDLLPCQHSVDRLAVTYLPGAVYAFLRVGYLAMQVLMRAAGYHHAVAGRISYWYRANAESRGAPVVFCHGLGPGLPVYGHLIQLLHGRSAFVVALELPWVAMQLEADVPTMQEITESIREIMDTHGIGNATLVGHSYGTFVAGAVHKRDPTMFDRLVLLDPVAISLFKHDVAFNAVYRSPYNPMTFAVGVLTHETHINFTLCRNFHWYECNVWGDELRTGDVIFVGGHDCILPAEDVINYVHSTRGAKVIFKERYHHAQVLFSPAIFDMVKRATRASIKAKAK